MDRRSTKQLWMMTHSGRKFYPSDIRPGDICIDDIAHALSNVCRFGGHCRKFYSVAQHSVHVAEVVETYSIHWWPGQKGILRAVLSYALMHDAAEAYLGDCVTPLKTCLPEYQRVEKDAMRSVLAKFGIPQSPFATGVVKDADRIMLVTEARDLLGSPAWMTNYDVEPLKKRIVPWSPAMAKKRFLRMFKELSV